MISLYRNFLGLRDPDIGHYFLMSSPIPMLTIVILYLAFVLKFGQEWMKNREPFKLDTLVQSYNILQIIGNSVLFALGTPVLLRLKFSCPVEEDPNDIRVKQLFYAYLVLKFVDFLDTIIFVLRKRNRQITFLHVYHHTFMVIGTWVYAFIYPGGPGIWVGLVNTMVHAIMYVYYFITVANSEDKKNIWWKKYITQIQIVQHCFVTYVLTTNLLDTTCSFSKLATTILLLQALHMIYMFVNFYYKAYIQVKNEKK